MMTDELIAAHSCLDNMCTTKGSGSNLTSTHCCTRLDGVQQQACQAILHCMRFDDPKCCLLTSCTVLSTSSSTATTIAAVATAAVCVGRASVGIAAAGSKEERQFCGSTCRTVRAMGCVARAICTIHRSDAVRRLLLSCIAVCWACRHTNWCLFQPVESYPMFIDRSRASS